MLTRSSKLYLARVIIVAVMIYGSKKRNCELGLELPVNGNTIKHDSLLSCMIHIRFKNIFSSQIKEIDGEEEYSKERINKMIKKSTRS